jgi:hypothetical protein
MTLYQIGNVSSNNVAVGSYQDPFNIDIVEVLASDFPGGSLILKASTLSNFANYGAVLTDNYMSFSGSSYLVGGSYEIGTGDFTLEAKFRLTSFFNDSEYIIGNSTYSNGIRLQVFPASVSTYAFGFFGIDALYIYSDNPAHVIPLNTWVEVAVSRISGVCRMYFNKQLIKTVSYGGSIGSPNAWNIGRWTLGNWYLRGDIEYAVLTLGKGKYSGSQIPDSPYLYELIVWR